MNEMSFFPLLTQWIKIISGRAFLFSFTCNNYFRKVHTQLSTFGKLLFEYLIIPLVHKNKKNSLLLFNKAMS